jgi:hypothetical protein
MIVLNILALGLVVASIVFAVSALLAFLSYLIFLRHVLTKTGSTAGMRDVAVAVRAFRDVFRTNLRGHR